MALDPPQDVATRASDSKRTRPVADIDLADLANIADIADIADIANLRR
jgi:hypothetical protein